MTTYETLDHELSLIPAVAFLLLLVYVPYVLVMTSSSALMMIIRRLRGVLRNTATTNEHSSVDAAAAAAATATAVAAATDQKDASSSAVSSYSSSSSNSNSISISNSKTRILVTLGLLLVASDSITIRPSFLLDYYYYQQQDGSGGLADLIQGTDPKLDLILQRVPALQQGPSPPFLFRNRHVQFIPWMIQNEIHRQQGIPFQRIQVPVSDCHHKKSLSSSLSLSLSLKGGDDDDDDDDDDSSDYNANDDYDYENEKESCHHDHSRSMNDTVTLDIFPPMDENSPYNNNGHFDFNISSPIILFAPGLRCYSQDLPGNMIIRKAYEQGFRSMVLNRRGHTPNQPLSSPRWNLFGDVDDMEQVYWFIQNELLSSSSAVDVDGDGAPTPHNTPMFLHGISSGTAVTVRALAKWDRRRQQYPERATPSFVASVAVTPGYDISKVMIRQRFQWPYNDILLPGVKEHFVLNNEDLLRRHNSQAVDEILNAKSLQEFVNSAAPFAGYSNLTLYYQDVNPINELRDITTPNLVLNARDDPCCHIANLYETSPYPQHDQKTYATMVSETQRALLAVTKTGSHCPFLDTGGNGNGNEVGSKSYFWPRSPFVRDPLTGGWMLNSWADRVSIDYYRAALDVYGERRLL